MRRILLPVLAAVLSVVGTSAASPPRSAVMAQQTVAAKYGPHPRQSVDVHWNSSPAPRPALVLIHGGYWYEQTDWSAWADKFADEGFQVFSIKYRLNFEAAWPAQREDVAAAVQWVRDNGAQYDADPANVVVLGSSAGGQMATDAATHGTNALGLKGVVALSPVASPYRAWVDGNTSTEAKVRKVRDNAAILARCYPDSTDNGTELRDTGCWDTWRDMVSKNWANPGDAPMYLVHSEGDFVPATHSADLEATAESRGVPAGDVTTTIVAGSSTHGGGLLSTAGMFDSVVSWLKDRTAQTP
ncbi:alpha/beta fold hydrolase [Streptomyces meridianus]|uniref:Alpha/beta hydrolase fold domain-containing protein n=1 Tax=Streptomyces meridianus TaxID=2938945 RepID=A0ABT0XAW4_9ACTN|nr:alpha/beta hydrolase [Streptomyces meridianus]MCM2579653.1 alpha/beta hydrolase fold domain-containing protein [Streptomyces meridianus]